MSWPSWQASRRRWRTELWLPSGFSWDIKGYYIYIIYYIYIVYYDHEWFNHQSWVILLDLMWSSTRASCGFYMSLWDVLVWFDVEFMRSFTGVGVMGIWCDFMIVWGLSIGISWDMLSQVQLISQLEIFGRVDCSGESEPVLWACRSNL